MCLFEQLDHHCIIVVCCVGVVHSLVKLLFFYSLQLTRLCAWCDMCAIIIVLLYRQEYGFALRSTAADAAAQAAAFGDISALAGGAPIMPAQGHDSEAPGE
jgi:hypothetical protein